MSGWTFAVAGEPDLDRVLRFQPAGATRRQPGPEIGVKVTRVVGAAAAAARLRGAAVDLLDSPVFEGRNGLAYEDQMEPILPVHLLVSGDGVKLQRLHADGQRTPLVTPPLGPAAPAAAAALGLQTPQQWQAFREQRAHAIRARLAHAREGTEKSALSERLEAFENRVKGITTGIMGGALAYDLPLAGPDATVEDVDGLLGPVETAAPWRLRLNLGCWDADALCLYAVGELELPTRHD